MRHVRAEQRANYANRLNLPEVALDYGWRITVVQYGTAYLHVALVNDAWEEIFTLVLPEARIARYYAGEPGDPDFERDQLDEALLQAVLKAEALSAPVPEVDICDFHLLAMTLRHEKQF